MTNHRPFVIFALPRSRTAWTSRFLRYGDWICGHDEVRHARSIDDLKAWFTQPCVGTVETAASPFWRSLDTIASDCRAAVIRRPVQQVVDSLMAFAPLDREALVNGMERYDRKLDQIEKRLDAFSITFDQLATEQGCKALFEYCLPYKHDPAHWYEYAGLNIQVDLAAIFRHYSAYRPSLERLGAMLRQQTLARLTAHPVGENDALSIQVDTFDDWERDGIELFAQHCLSVGELPDQWTRKNIPLLRALYEAGAMQIMTARSNGRMFGYLVTLIHPSLTLRDLTTATNTLFFATDDFKGLGLKLQRAALAELKKRGVREMFWEASKRGSGPKLGTLYRRLGAVEHGETYRLELSGA